ncbi:MAG: AAA family ATPase [Opitutales bacterium]|jgi:predicted ATPase
MKLPPRSHQSSGSGPGYIRAVRLKRAEVPSFAQYPFCIPVVRHLERLELHPAVTFLVGENGSGKSTLVEAIATKFGFNAEGGSKNFNFATEATHSALKDYLVLEKSAARATDGYFLRAESFYNVATEVDRLGVTGGYGQKSLHAQSHGEAFLALLTERFQGGGLYLLDEPEAALSPQRQLSVLVLLHRLVLHESQLIIATHSPILLAYPRARIYRCGESGLTEIRYTDTEHYQITKDFLNSHERSLERLLGEEDRDFAASRR